MNIIVSHAYSKDNKGDAALLSVLLKDLKDIEEITKITILTEDKTVETETFEDIMIKSAFVYDALSRYQNKLLKLLYSTFVMSITLIWAWVYRISGKRIWLPENIRKTADMYLEADMIVTVGGGYIRSKSGIIDTFTFALLLHPLAIARILKRPIFMYPQSIGPFYNPLQKYLVKIVLSGVDMIVLREDISVQILRDLGIKNNVMRSVDSGFLFTSNIDHDLRKELMINSQGPIVGITARQWLQKEHQNDYEKNLASFVDYIIEKYDAFVVFIPQVTAADHQDDDRVVNRNIYRHLKNKGASVLLDGDYDHFKIKAVYEKLDFLIGTRFHSVIFALISYVPCIAIEYEHKTSGIMRDLGLEKWVLSIDLITHDRLTNLFDKLICEKNDYAAKLRQDMPAYLKKAEETKKKFKDFVGKHNQSHKHQS